MNDINTIDDKNLIEAYQNGDQEALSKLIKKYYPYIYKVLTYYKKIPVDRAEDYTHDICLRLIKSLDSLKIKNTFKSYLDRMINNKVIDDYRDRLKNKELSLFSIITSDNNETILLETFSASDDSSIHRELCLKLENIIKHCLSQIKNKKMQQLVNFWLNGFRDNHIKRKDMARLLNVTLGFVNGTLERGKAIFRECFKKHYSQLKSQV